ncbi:hypothetical protein niasHS_007747 [Heterodera schachtii]|uniref:Uncharacterized protein n=1 Tax=Heterodera schachtii TaxID=97005 RepID=A0ABD2JPM2_HETSC
MQTINYRRNAAQANPFWRPFCKVYADNNGKTSEEFNEEAQESADVPQLKNAAASPKIIAAATKAILVPIGTFFVHQTQSKRAMASECGGGECQQCDNIGKFENEISMVTSKGQKNIIRAQEEEEEEEKRKSEEEEEEQQQQEEEEEEEEPDGTKKGSQWEKHYGKGAMGGGPCGGNGGKQCPRRCCCCCCCGCAKECERSEKGADKSILGPINSQQSAQKKVPLRLFKPFFARNANFGVFNSPPKLIGFNDKVAEKQRSSVDESLENLKERLGKISNKLDFWKTNLLRKPLQAIDESIPTAADQQQKETSRADQLKMLKEVISKELAAITVTEKLTKTLLDNGDENAAKDGDGRNSTATAQTVLGITSSSLSSTTSTSTSTTTTTTTTISTTTQTATVTSSNSTEGIQQQKQQMPMEIIKTSAPAFSSSSATTLSTTPTAEGGKTITTTEMPSQNGTKNGTTTAQQIDQIVTSPAQLIQTTTTTISDFDSTTSSTSTPTAAVNGTLFTLTTRQLQTASAAELPTPPPYVPANEPSNMPIINVRPVIVQEMAPTDNATGNNGTAQSTTLMSLTQMDQNGNDKANAFISPTTTPVTIMKSVPQTVVSSNEKTMTEQNAYTDHLPPILPNLDIQNITKPNEEEKENGTKERMNRMQFDENNLGQINNVKMEDPQIAVNGRPISLVSSNFASKNVKESEHKNSEFREYPHRKIHDTSK